MRKILFILLMTGLLCPVAAFSQMAPVALVSRHQQLYAQFMRCVDSKDCTKRERVQIMQEMNKDMGQSLQKIYQECLRRDFESCVDPQAEDVRSWHETHSRVEQMMQALEVETLGGNTVAATQDPIQEQKRWWNKAWPKPTNR